MRSRLTTNEDGTGENKEHVDLDIHCECQSRVVTG